MRNVVVLCMVVLLSTIALSVDLHADETARPDWCRKVWICVTAEEISEDTIYKINLREELAVAKAKSSRMGWDLGCGVGVAVVIDEDYNVNAPPAGFCGVTIAFWRFR